MSALGWPIQARFWLEWGGKTTGCPMSARRWQTWDSATPTTKTPGAPPLSTSPGAPPLSIRFWSDRVGRGPGAPCLPPGGPFKPAFGLSGGKGDGCPMSARCWQTWDSATPTGNPPGCPTLVDPILERQGGSGDGCPMSARRWQTWDSATPTAKPRVPHPCRSDFGATRWVPPKSEKLSRSTPQNQSNDP